MKEPMSIEEFAAALYEKYCEGVGGVAFNGDRLPAWSQFAADPSKTKQAQAWLVVGAEARRLVAAEALRLDAPPDLTAGG